MKNWANRTIWAGDNLPIMRGMNSESVDLIYLDPPFNSNANYAAPIGSPAEGAEFKDIWTLSDLDTEGINLIEAKHPKLYQVLLAAMTDSDKAYLSYMADRLMEMHRILKPTGSIYLHCDPTMSHYLKIVMDAVFGRRKSGGGGGFKNEIIWRYSTFRASKKNYKRNYDQILFYTKSDKYVFNWKEVADPYDPKTIARFDKQDENGRYKIIKGRKHYMGAGTPPSPSFFHPQLQMNSAEYLGYPTQKPLAVIERIIKASSNYGDTILDPFCGCATACVAAEKLVREWIGIDTSPRAVDLVRYRLKEELQIAAQLSIPRDDIPQRKDLGKTPPYRTHKKTLYGEQAGNCAGCATHFEIRHLEVDHIIAKQKGGTDHIENLQLLCGSCNKIKGNRGMEYLKLKLQLR